MAGKYSLVLVFVGDLYLKITRIAVNCCEEFRRTQAIEAVVHPRKGVRVFGRDGVEASVVDTEQETAFIFRC